MTLALVALVAALAGWLALFVSRPRQGRDPAHGGAVSAAGALLVALAVVAALAWVYLEAGPALRAS